MALVGTLEQARQSCLRPLEVGLWPTAVVYTQGKGQQE